MNTTCSGVGFCSISRPCSGCVSYERLKRDSARELMALCKDLNKLLADAGYGAKCTDLDDAAVELSIALRKIEKLRGIK